MQKEKANHFDTINDINVVHYFRKIAEEVAKEENVSIELSTCVDSLILGWSYKNKGSLDKAIWAEFESDFKDLLTAEIHLLKEIRGQNMTYWLVRKIDFEK